MKQKLLLLFLILLAFFLRVWQVGHIPPGLWYDEAYYSMDAAWLLDGGSWQLFFAGNNGREPIFIYLQSLFIWIFGATPLTSRLLAPLLGTLAVPLVYVLARRLSRSLTPLELVPKLSLGTSSKKFTPSVGTNAIANNQLPTYLPLLATAGLAVSFWHIGLSRGGYRAVLFPLVTALIFYAFWRGWQDKSFKWFGMAGLALGVSQYTYLAARALPLVFALFVLVWTAFSWRKTNNQSPNDQLPTLWLGLSLMALLAAIVFAPLGWLFYQNPALFSARTGDVLFTPETSAELIQHLTETLRLFIDGGDSNWRHHLPGRPMLGWLGWLGFWPGLFLCLRHLHRAGPLFLLVALLTLYLPALFAVPPIHALRLSALLPIYYPIFAWGLIWVANAVCQVSSARSPKARKAQASSIKNHASGLTPRASSVILIAVMVIETGLTYFDYFQRWAAAQETYVEYNGPLVDLVYDLVKHTGQEAVIIPFQLYVHPTTRYLLHDGFTEAVSPPDLAGPAQLVALPDAFKVLNVANIPGMPAWIWLGYDAQGRDVAYVSRSPRLAEQNFLKQLTGGSPAQVYRDRWGRELAQAWEVPEVEPLAALFTQTAPERSITLTWAEQVQLQGYDVLPPVVQPGQPLTLNLYWRSLTDATFDERLFLQLIDAQGRPINQWEGDAFREDMYRWRPNGILPSQHTLWVGPDTPPGPYLVRLGFFDKATDQRLPVRVSKEANQRGDESGGQPLDQIQLGLFYVSPDGADPRLPASPFPTPATFDDNIKLIGVTLPSPLLPTPYSLLPVTFHWHTLHPTDKPYTVFLQLLNQKGEVVAGWDSQPFNGLYPTNLWSPGEIIAATINLPLPKDGLPPGGYHLITGFYEVATGQRLPVDSGGDFVELAQFVIKG
ncbi:MAG: hypothetical protein U0401_13475 [Anaerolineae bacterium]